MKISRTLLLTAAGLLFSLQLLAQKDFTEDANIAYENESYYQAIDLYKKAYSKERSRATKAEILFKIAQSYRFMNELKQAEVWYQKAINAKYPDPNAILFLAEVLKQQGNYEDAISEFNNYLQKTPGDADAKEAMEATKKAQEWEDAPTQYEVQNEVLLNSKASDFSPTFADRRKTSLIFTSTREGSTGKDIDGRSGENFSDLYYSKRDRKGKWSVPDLLNETVNTEANEGSSCLDDRAGYMYFTRCGIEKGKSSSCSIFGARKMGPKFDEPELINIEADTFTLGHPSVSKDEKLLFFASDMPGGEGGKDIWYIKYNEGEKAWQSQAINAGSEVNTPADDMFPFIHNDGSLYFASNGHPGMGGLDIFRAEKTGDEKWGNVENLKYPINSSYDDFGIIFEDTKDKGYFSSNRKGGKGKDDIYSFYKPPLVFRIQGNITDVDSREPLQDAAIKLIGTDGTSVEIKSDEMGYYEFGLKEGSKDFYIQPNTSYSILVSKEDYLNAKGQETTVGVEESTTFIHDFTLQSIEEEEITFPEVLYDLAKWELRPESKDSLDYLYQTLVDNPTIIIELSAHTDSRGGEKYNQDLSQKRAESCVEYLISKGIDTERLIAKGYGENKLLIQDKEINKLPTEEEKEAAHQKNRRTVFSVISTDFVPKEKPEEGKASNENQEDKAPEEKGTN